MDDKKESEQQFQFLHEEVLVSKRKPLTVSQIIILVTVCGMIFGTVSCLMFFGLMPTVQNFFDIEKSTEAYIGAAEPEVTALIEVLGEDETISEPSVDELVEGALKEYQKEEADYLSVRQSLGKVGNDMEPSMATIVSYKSEDWMNQTEKDKTVTSGIILKASLEEGVVILTDTASLLNNKKLVAYLCDERGYSAELFQTSTLAGISLIRIDGALLNQDVMAKLQVVNTEKFTGFQGAEGEGVILLGNPYSTNRYMAYGSLTSVDKRFSQTDAQYELMTTNITDGGNMNGFIMNLDGDILGMVLQSHKADKMKQMVTATRMESLKVFLNRMLEGRDVSYMGIKGQEITEEVIQNVDIDMPKGIYITKIENQSPAFHAGLMRGDILVKIGQTEVLNLDTYTDTLQQCPVNTVVKVTVMRKGKNEYKPIVYDVVVGSR